METHNPNCDGGHCRAEAGEVRTLPMSKEPYHGNLILCRACHVAEIAWRKGRNKELTGSAKFDTPKWEALEVYKQ